MGGHMTLFLLHMSGHISDETANLTHYETRTSLCFLDSRGEMKALCGV